MRSLVKGAVESSNVGENDEAQQEERVNILDCMFEAALDSISAGMSLVGHRYRPRGLVIAGDFNVELSHVHGGGALGTCLWPTVGPNISVIEVPVAPQCKRTTL